MKMILAFLTALLLPVSAQAVYEPKLLPECAVLAQNGQRQAAGVGPNYVPGVDVRGKPVVPADGGSIGGTVSSIVPDPIVVPLTVDLAERAGLSTKGAEMNAAMGFLEIYADGRVLYNGQDLTSKIHALCGMNPQETAPAGGPDANRQTPPDIIESAPVKEIAPKPPVTKPITPPAPQPAPEPEQGELLEGGEYAE